MSEGYHTFRVHLTAMPQLGPSQTEIYLDDQPLRGVRRITIDANMDTITTVTIEMFGNVIGDATVLEDAPGDVWRVREGVRGE